MSFYVSHTEVIKKKESKYYSRCHDIFTFLLLFLSKHIFDSSCKRQKDLINGILSNPTPGTDFLMKGIRKTQLQCIMIRENLTPSTDTYFSDV